jgi:sialate O-acetylesterase
MANYPNIRMYKASNVTFDVPQVQETNPQLWRSGPDPLFSAVCWLYGRNIFDKLEPPRPIGLVDVSVGATPDEHWSSPDALAKCSDPAKPTKDSVHWNGMVLPFLNTTIKGVIWYQGEANSFRPGGMYNGYNCTFPAMIDDWRIKWHEGTDGNTDSEFPFGFVQLGSVGTDDAYNEPTDDPQMGEFSSLFGYGGIRWAQTAGYGYAPNPRMPKTFMAVNMDTPMSDGNVHSIFKQPTAARLARAGLAVAYGMQFDTNAGPSVKGVEVEGDSVTVKLIGLGKGGVQIRSTTGFEVLVNDGGVAAPGVWVNTPITGHQSDSVTIGALASNASKIRYSWYSKPCGLDLFGCAVYTGTTALGNLSGELDFMPLPPFIQDLPSGATNLAII